MFSVEVLRSDWLSYRTLFGVGVERSLNTSFIKSWHRQLAQHGRRITLLARKSKNYHLVTRESHQDDNKDVIESSHCPHLSFQTSYLLSPFKNQGQTTSIKFLLAD